MNKKVLQTMIYLCWGFLISFCILKVFFADNFIISINNPRIIIAGTFIDNHIWLQQIIYGITTFLTYHFYLCACCQKWKLSIKQYIYLIIIIALTNTLKYYFQEISFIVNILIMVILPYLLKSNYKVFITIFIAHILGQLAVTYIRCEELINIDNNFLSAFIMCIDAYFWLLLYYLYSNKYKENIMGNIMPPLWNKMSEEIKKQISITDERIAKTTDEKKLKRLKKEKNQLLGLLDEK